MKKIVYITLISVLSLFFYSCDTSEKDFEKAKQVNSIEAYESFVEEHPNSVLADEARNLVVNLYKKKPVLEIPTNHQDTEIADRLNAIVSYRVDSLYSLAEKENTISGWQAYIDEVPSEYARDANEHRESLVDEAYHKAERTKTIDGWKEYINAVPVRDVRDAIERIRELEEQAVWSTESKAWETASSRETTASFEKYLELYPRGAHARQAEKQLIDLEVESVFAGEHGTLPSMDKGYSTGASYSIIEIENRTRYTLTVNYSGPDSKRLVIPASGMKKIRINNGYYRVAASVGHGVIPFAGTEKLDGSYFSSSFYITTSRY